MHLFIFEFHSERLLVIGFVLINTELGSESEVIKGLKEIPSVKEVYSVYGVYDIIVRLEAESMEDLKDIIITKVRRLKKVRSTLTVNVI
jgi:DNA-binding Lrp family transcriptional regulator